MSRPELSVIVPTRNRSDSLSRLLRRLGEGTFAPDRFEVIVVTDGAPEVETRPDRRQNRFALRWIAQPARLGAGAARNRGAAEALGDILVFLDDDIEPDLRLLEDHHRTHAATMPDPAVSPLVVIGAPRPVRPPVIDQHHRELWAWWERRFERMEEPGHRFTYDEVLTGILSMPADLFRRTGGFDLALDWAREDHELGIRLIQLRCRFQFIRTAGGIHHEIRNRHELLARKRAEGAADLVLVARHPGLWAASPLAAAKRSSLAHRGLVFVALRFGWACELAIRLSGPILDLLERLGLRGSWRLVQGGAAQAAYWRGVATGLRHPSFERASFRALEARAENGGGSAPVCEMEVDLASGPGPAGEQLDALRPDAVRLRYGAIELGRIDPVPGAEPLRAAHLAPLLLRGWSERLAPVLAWAVLARSGRSAGY